MTNILLFLIEGMCWHFSQLWDQGVTNSIEAVACSNDSLGVEKVQG
ncbi:hypothetical protein HanRHA438_Chr00c02g0843921 [Helianthus annuus]|uniref:Uncharacterized protein n=1 Tax=Helianthus annuus TaxID=4232 RepID=A0A9K3IMB1_HELAN|nr:hypothetical protein HanXRQr2_Chr07g0305191 [Helianthus annuus]KAJ0955114.1 hypothetical protein HanRHA438_Chr00c02g0843921 [Helianthus annuus]